MTRFATILTATAMILGSMIWTANAQIQTLGLGLHAQIQNATPIVKPAACRGGRARIVRRVTFGTGTGAARASE